MQKQYENNVWETRNDTYSLSIRVQTTINHVLSNLLRASITHLLYLLVSTRAVISQFSGPYSPVRPAKI